MRIRHKPWAVPELLSCGFFVEQPAVQKGRWRELFPHPERPLHLELGCGKGGFLAQMGEKCPQVNFIGVDIKSDMLGVGKRTICKAYGDRPVENIRLAAYNIELISDLFSKEDEIERIYINFCNPWPRKKHNKKRLTHPRQLTQYKDFLAQGREIWFKTDNDELFEASLSYFEECGFTITTKIFDLHESGFSESVPTEHEAMFTSEGIPTKFLIAKR